LAGRESALEAFQHALSRFGPVGENSPLIANLIRIRERLSRSRDRLLGVVADRRLDQIFNR
jgi:hypothetical protein